jgi:hypothetical protein
MIIGVTALPQTGKDTFFEYFREYCGYTGKALHRVSFGDSLRSDLRSFVEEHYDIDIVHCTPEEKELIRPLMIAHGQCLRKKNPDTLLNRSKHLVRKIINEEQAIPFYTDVRFNNEVDYIKSAGGIVVHLSRKRNPYPQPDSPELLGCLERADIHFNLSHIDFTGEPTRDYEQYLNKHRDCFTSLYNTIKEFPTQ